jgi:hypothetical protein
MCLLYRKVASILVNQSFEKGREGRSCTNLMGAESSR